MRYIGKPIRRVIEDKPLLLGRAQFVNDLTFPGTLYAVFIRSQYPHARFKSINCPDGCFTAKDFPIDIGFANEETVFMGQPIAVVVAEDEYTARDLAEKVEVEYEPLEPIVDPIKAMDEKSPKARSDLKSNIYKEDKVEGGDIDNAFSKADKIIEGTLINQRVIPAPIEPRGAVAYYDGKRLTIWSSTQSAFFLKRAVEEITSKLGVYDVRAIQPFVGGAFGSKIRIYAEELAVASLAIILNKPVKWFNTRTEEMMSENHGRDMILKYKAAFDKEGHLLGIDGDLIYDLGAPIPRMIDSSFNMAKTAAQLLAGRYNIKGVRVKIYGVVTNKAYIAAYRGAGRPEGNYFMERIMNLGARALGIDQFEIRERNIIPEVYRYTTITGLIYDSGKYIEILKEAKSVYEELIKERNELRAKGNLAGVSVSIVNEIAAFGPYLTAKVKVLKNGRIQVISGAGPHGQGDATGYAQIAAEIFDVDINNIDVLWGDTDLIADGNITAGSKSITVGGSAVYEAAIRLKDKLTKVVAEKFKVAPDKISYSGGYFINTVTGDKESLGEASNDALNMGVMPEEMYSYTMKDYTSPYGVHLALVNIDPEVGKISVLRYIGIDDVGVVINPLLAEGQVHGGVLQGVSQALYEEAIYSPEGYLLTSNLADYPLPTSVESIKVEWKYRELSKSETPLGSKGIGEHPTIASTVTIINAIEDAIGKEIYDMPITPEKVLKLLGKL
ncbi:MAG: xanthine dehydrogenase family protein molybdopterin-binding subunit [Sulfolobus sp.]|nr:xanthine dehydrogenase family protein molybdopterin-binding subunit [Sulfolobus sp.]